MKLPLRLSETQRCSLAPDTQQENADRPTFTRQTLQVLNVV